MTEREIFTQALDRPAGQRAVFLERACEGDAPLRKRIERLLAQHDRLGGYLEAPAGILPASLGAVG